MLKPGEDAQHALDTQDSQPSDPDSTQPPAGPRPVPWPLTQTITGLLLTLAPWLIFSIGATFWNPSTSASTVHISRTLDIITGVLVFFISALLECIFLLAPLTVVGRLRIPDATWRDRLSWLGLRRVTLRPALDVFVIGSVVGIGANAIYGWFVTTFNLPLQTNTESLLQQARTQPFTTLGILLASALIAPICEEIFFRGFAFSGLLRGMTLIPAMLISSAIFAVAHTDVGSLVPLFIIGIVLAWARWRTDSIWPGVAIHALNNILAAVALLPYLFK